MYLVRATLRRTPMLKQLSLQNVGPAEEMHLDLAPRLNLITGDNGLGKSFLLDVAWWALTRRWPRDVNPKLTSGYPARPSDPKKTATISFGVSGKSKSIKYESSYSTRDQAWIGKAGRPWNPGLVLYAHSDGGFSVWDPARNYWKRSGNIDVQERLPGYVFSPKEVWDGLKVPVQGEPTVVCNGLLVDWAAWISEGKARAKNLRILLKRMTTKEEPISLGPLTRLSVDDAREIPTIRTPYASEVPILHASSGMRRVLGLCYMLLWSWQEHRSAAKLLGEKPTQQIVLLFDEVENHLHPRWQRTILRALLGVSQELHANAEVQLIAATHSPLILASAEPFFDNSQDAWFDLDLEGSEVHLQRKPFVRHGEVGNWLTSEAFDLAEPRSLEGEEAVRAAEALMSEVNPSQNSLASADAQLRAAGLPDIDPFWIRWGYFLEKKAST